MVALIEILTKLLTNFFLAFIIHFGDISSSILINLKEPLRKKYGIIWEFFPTGGWGSPQSQNFCDLTK